MKKLLSISLALLLLLSLCMPAFAAAGDVTLTYDLSCEGSHLQNGTNEIVVQTGEVITVAYQLSANLSASVSVTQDEIYYDHSFFALVSGSNKTSDGYGDYVTSLQTRLDGKRYVYFNTLVTHTHTTASVEIGTFQLKVIATSGESTVASVNNKATDAQAAPYDSAAVNLHVSISNPQPQRFTVTYAANGGTVSPTEQTVDAGTPVSLPTPSRQYYNFAYWSISGDSTQYSSGQSYTPNSDVTFTAVWTPVAVPSAPTGLSGVNASSAMAADGKITGTTTDMEYSITAAFADAKTCGAVVTTGLKASTYYVRIKAVGNTPASTYAIVVVAANTAGGIGGGGITSYKISIITSVNGIIAVNFKDAPQGSTVMITSTPNTGYTCGGVKVTDISGTAVAVSKNGDGTYTFVMPNSEVTVTAFFVKISGNSEGYKDCKKDGTCPMKEFTDLDLTVWYHDGVHYCLESGLMTGVDNNLFAPNGTSTRAMIVTILYRLEGSPTITGSSPYNDVLSGLWYTDAVVWADSNKIIGGYGTGTFGPNDPITREQIAAILYRYASYKGYDVTQTSDLSRYTDASEIIPWALTSVKWANAVGLINGRTATMLAPEATATRAEIATLIMRFCQNNLK